MEEKVRAISEQRERQEGESIGEMEKHPRCALLPSPEKLDLFGEKGSDLTATLQDFDAIKSLAEKHELIAGFYEKANPKSEVAEATLSEGAELVQHGDSGEHNMQEDLYYGTFIGSAFNNAFVPTRNTFSPELDELVFWYYCGHGLDKGDAEDLNYSSAPQLENTGQQDRLSEEYVKTVLGYTAPTKVKGGEMCLHKVGFCGLAGLLAPWVSAVHSKSINSEGVKKNKHLVIIADSCYSGMLARDFEELKKKNGPWNQDGCSVTVQAACGEDEVTYGGYFTPTFLHLNEHPEKLKELKEEWSGMGEKEKEKYKSSSFPSPMLVTSANSPQAGEEELTMERNMQNFPLVLFRDAGFFKYCFCRLFRDEEVEFLSSHGLIERALTAASADKFLQKGEFIVIDYKLTVMKDDGSFQDSPLGLFLLEYPWNQDVAVCAHVHFRMGDTSRVGRINLVHHKRLVKTMQFPIVDPPKVSVAAVQGVDWKWQRGPTQTFGELARAECPGANQHKQKEVSSAMIMVKKCYEFVNKHNPALWNDTTQWNMGGSFMGKFRKNERSTYMAKYLENIQEYNLPTV